MHNKIDVVIMAGGKGIRLMPLTEKTPKPLLKVGNKPIIEYNTDLLASYGFRSIYISVNHFSDQIISYFKANNKHQIKFHFIKESKPLGTIGALKQKGKFKKDYILVLNADLLTTINLKTLFNHFISQKADALVTTVFYNDDIPNDVLEIENGLVTALKLKQTSSHNLNAGIYMFKKSCLDYIPVNISFNATDLIKDLLKLNKKIVNYPISNYWIDIGTHKNFKKAQEDIKTIKL